MSKHNEETITIGMSNTWPAASNQKGWLKLAEYGDWPHARGLQRFSREAAETMVRQFKSLRGRLARRFGGLPVYIGHPDDPGYSGQSGHEDTRAYAWVTDLQAREDGLYILPRWSQAGRELLSNAFYKYLSPRWVMQPLEGEAYAPSRLISIGLTNQPNIPGDPIANATRVSESGYETTPIETLDVLDLLGIDPEGDWQTACRKLAANALRGQSCKDDPQTEAMTAENERFYRLACESEKAREVAETQFEQEREARIELLLDQAESSGRFSPAQREHWQERLEHNFTDGERALSAAANALKTSSCLDISQRVHSRPRQGTDFIALVNERTANTGEDFTTAWSNLKRERPELYQQLEGLI